jgi:succinate-acetate transporter protein
MLDLLFIALTIIFFLLCLAYVRGCEKLRGDARES